jgi:hypothetical protein
MIVVFSVVGAVVCVTLGTLQHFSVSSPTPGQPAIQCNAPLYGAGHDLSGSDATACDDQARTRAETGGLAAAAFIIAGFGLSRIVRQPQ